MACRGRAKYRHQITRFIHIFLLSWQKLYQYKIIADGGSFTCGGAALSAWRCGRAARRGGEALIGTTIGCREIRREMAGEIKIKEMHAQHTLPYLSPGHLNASGIAAAGGRS